MLLGFVGLGAVVETAYLPAIRKRFDTPPHCLGFDIQPVKQPEGVTRCSTLSELLSQPLDTLFITTSSLHHLEVLEHALASSVSRIVVEKPIVATLPQTENSTRCWRDPTPPPGCWRSITGWRASKR